MSKIWYEKPASRWEEALPIGNGRLGAMVFGGTDWERIQLNEESIWYGAPMKRINPNTLENLSKIRALLSEGKIDEAECLMGFSMSGRPNSMHPYQTLGDIYFNFNDTRVVNEGICKKHSDEEYEAMEYYRELDIAKATTFHFFNDKGTKFTKEVFVSKPDDCMIIHMKAEGKDSINFSSMLCRGKNFDGVNQHGNDGIVLYGNLGRGGFEFATMLRGKVKGGSLKLVGEYLCVSQAQEVWLYLDAMTSYRLSEEVLNKLYKDCDSENEYKDAIQSILVTYLSEKLDKVMAKDYEDVKQSHIEDYESLFKRVELNIDGMYDYENIPTDKRLANMKNGTIDIGLQRILFDFGRYLLISCSRPGDLPANLQGIWADGFATPWDSKYTININTEMNYWPAEICNLSECHMPLFDLLRKMQIDGRKTAKEMYGCRGFVAHHNTNIFGDTAPQDIWYPGTYWVMGAAWICTHVWTHFLYTKDVAFLESMFPAMLESALFFVDFLVERKGKMVTSPSVSPENTYILPNGEYGCICEGPTMDSQILRDLFEDCILAYYQLGKKAENVVIPEVDSISELIETINDLSNKLPETKIGSKGQILEWMEEYEEVEPGHRHISHLFGLFPSEQITVDGTPKLASAARKTLERRLASGGGHTGWSCAWIINHYAKLWDGEKANDMIVKMLSNSTYPNMFDMHPPFQIDGNFGVTAGIANMLVQSNQDRIVILPALPKEWKTGNVSGLRIVGNASVDISWKDGELENLTIYAENDLVTVLKYKDKEMNIAVQAGEALFI